MEVHVVFVLLGRFVLQHLLLPHLCQRQRALAAPPLSGHCPGLEHCPLQRVTNAIKQATSICKLQTMK